MKICIYNEKGGAGKTTAAVTLAVLMGLPVLDLDKQGTASRWLERRAEKLPVASRNLDWVADCAPGISPNVLPVLAAADVVIVPVRASFPDLVSLSDTINFIKTNSKAKICFICADLDTRSSDAILLLENLANYDLPVLGEMTHRVSYRRAALSGKIASEIDMKAHAEAAQIVQNLSEI